MFKFMFLVSVRSLWLVIVTWIQLVRAMIYWHTSMCWRFILWTVNVTTLPVRALGALQREKLMKRLLQEMQSELENLAWDNEKLQAHLKMTVKEHHLLESMLAELEEDHDKAIVKIELLESEVQHLKYENLRLREIQSKGLWNGTGKSDSTNEQTTYGSHGISWQSSEENESNKLLEGLLMHQTSWAKEQKPGSVPNPTGLVDPLTPLIFSTNVDADAALYQRREVALSQSLFSAVLSLLVGMIIWEAEDPCMPLVMALFTVVGLSLRSVVQFFSTIKNRPASDAVALLSFNWFILGTLTYPTLPRVARMLCPVVVTSVEWVLSWLGLS